MKISLCGLPGTGSGVIGEMLARGLTPPSKFISAGDIFNALAAKRGITALQLEQQARTDAYTDQCIYRVIRKMYQRESRLVVDAHLAWHEPAFQDAYKVLLIRPFSDRVAEIVRRNRIAASDVGFVSERLALSGMALMDRYWQRSKVSLADIEHAHPRTSGFNLVIDVSKRFSYDEIVDEINAQYMAWAHVAV